jgi:hypothetical protein
MGLIVGWYKRVKIHSDLLTSSPHKGLVELYLKVFYACAADGKGWDALHYDMQELILAKRPLLELARISRTHTSFQAVFLAQLAREQKAHCNLIVECLGRARLARIATLISRFLKWEALEQDLDDYSIVLGLEMWEDVSRWANGTFEPPSMKRKIQVGSEDTVLIFRLRIKEPIEGGNVVDVVDGVNEDTPAEPTTMVVTMTASESSQIRLSVTRGNDGGRIIVLPYNDEDLLGVALMQALLSGDWGPNLVESGLVAIRIFARSYLADYSHGGLEAQILLLLPFASAYHRFNGGPLVEGLPVVRERVRFRDVGKTATKGVTIQLDLQ